MANTKKAILKAKIEGNLVDLMVKTTGENVYLEDGTTLAAKVAAILTDVGNRPTTTAMNTAISQAISATGHASFEKVDAVPAVADAQDNILYLVKNTATGHYDIYAKIAGDSGATMELLDDTNMDLSGKVDKVEGKGLSANDYTTEEKNKLAGIAAGAEVNKIEGIQMNGAALTPDAVTRIVNISLGALADKDKVAEADLDDDLKAKVNAAAEGNHSHDNKAVLDGITADQVAAWDGKSKVYYAAAEPAALAEGDLWVQLID